MDRILPVSICLVSLLFRFAAADEPRPIPEKTLPPAPLPAAGGSADVSDAGVEHLLKAAQHLQAAGRTDEAARLRYEAREMAAGETLLGRKEAELECLQEEVDRLRALTGQAQSILVKVTAVEVDRQRLGLKAREFDRMVGIPQPRPDSAEQPAGMFAISEADPARLPLFRELREKQALCVLAEPNITTVPRRPARFLDGGFIPLRVRSASGEISVNHVWFGIELEVQAVVLPNQRLRLQAAFELRERVASGVVDDDGTACPGIRSRRLNTEVEMRFGQTLALGRAVFSGSRETNDDKQKGAAESREMIVFVTPQLVDRLTFPQAGDVLPAAAGALDESIVPEGVDPADAESFGPAIPILKRRTVRD